MRLELEDTTVIAISEFREKDALKGAGFRWNPDGKYWHTDRMENVAKLIDIADMDDELLALAEKANESKAQALDASRAVDANIDIPAPDGLAYMPFQRAGIAFGSSRPNTLIADEMGLGKTIQAIGIINADPTAKKVLVVCPASLKLNWAREMEKWFTRSMSIGIANGAIPNTDVVIVNYDILKKHQDALTARDWDVAIVDEIHYCKNPKAQRTKATVAIASTAKRIIALTGTPIVNRPVEAFTILNLLDSETWSNFFSFARRYCNAHKKSIGRRMVWDFSGASNLSELQEKLRTSIMVRRLKADVLTDLPAKQRQIIVLPPNGLASVVKNDANVMAEIEAMLSEMESSTDYTGTVEEMSQARKIAFEQMSQRRHDTALAKVPYVATHVRDTVEQTGKVIVMAHHHDVIDALAADLDDLGVVTLTGRDNQAHRQNAVDTFQTDPNINIFIGSIQAAGVGITLTASSTVVFAELDWVPGNVSQAEDRAHRIGQTDSVLVQHIVIDGTIDARLAKTLIRKQAVLDKALDSEIKTAPIPMPEVKPEPQKQAVERRKTESLTDIQVDALQAAMRMLASLDPDHASERNDVGFNGADGDFGHSLAIQVRWSAKQAAAAKKMLKKYHRQIPEEIYEAIGYEAR